jgi:hypothetical protein
MTSALAGFLDLLRSLGPFRRLEVTEDGMEGVFCAFTPVRRGRCGWLQGATGYSTGPRTLAELRRGVPERRR